MKQKDYMLVAAIFLCSLAGLYFYTLSDNHAETVEIRKNGTFLCELNLQEDQTYIIEGTNHAKNILIIKNREAWISEASCPDKICMKQGKISKEGQVIICLPNTVTVTVHSHSK